jgi:Zn-dependent protease
MRTYELGTFSEIPVRLHWGALALATLFGFVVGTGVLPELAPGGSDAAYLLGGLLAGAALLASIFIHEAAHALVARRHGVAVSSITLWLLGGVAHLEDEAPNPRAEAQIAGVGPLSSFILAAGSLGVGWALFGIAPVLGATLLWVGGLNVVLALFNLLPGAPLDGGRLLHAWLWRRHGSRARATSGASRAGRVLGLIVAGLGLVEVFAGNLGGLWTALIGWFLYGAAGQEAQHGRLSEALQELTAGDVMGPLPATVADWSSIEQILNQHRSGDTRLLAVDFSGKPTAVVTVAEIARAAANPSRRQTYLRLRDLGLPKPTEVEFDSPAKDLLRQPGSPAVVTHEGQPIGVVSRHELELMLARHQLGVTAPDRTDDALAA